MSKPSATLVKDRVESGLYDAIGEQIVAMETAALAGAEYNRDYKRRVEAWSGNYVYKDTKGVDFRTIIVSEIQGSESGTIIAAKGNHYPGPRGTPFRPITDDSRVKDVLTIGLPTGATELLEVIVDNQLAELNSVLEADDVADEAAGKDPIVKEWVKNADGSNEGVKNLTTVHMLPKYGKPANAKATGGQKRRVAKRSLTTLEHGEDEAPAPPPVDPKEVREGAFYDPYLNEDYGGPYFQHVRNKLVQLDVHDENNELVAPWKFHLALRPGTVVLLNCSLHCFIMKDKSGERKVYQINAHSVRILAPSDVEVPEPVKPTIPSVDGEGGTSELSTLTRGSAAHNAAKAFGNFSTLKHAAPSKESSAQDNVEPSERKAKKPRKKETINAKAGSSMDVDL